MGLDITAYSGLVATEHTTEGLDDEAQETLDLEDHLVRFHRDPDEDDPHGTFEGLESGRYYTHDERMSWRAGSYSGYNHWRNRLAQLVGHASAEAAWASPQPGPFIELIDFSDCEGTLGPVVCAKLAQDFAQHAVAAEAEGGYFWELYQSWQAGMEMAAQGGAVDFH